MEKDIFGYKPKPRTCCCIPDQTKLDQVCPKPAEWQIWSGTGPDDYTEACSAHVGLLLSDAPEHRILPIKR